MRHCCQLSRLCLLFALGPSDGHTAIPQSHRVAGWNLSSQLVEVLKVEHIHLIHLKYSLNWHKCEILMRKWVDPIICWPPFIDNWSLTLTAFNFKLNVVTTNVSLNTNHISKYLTNSFNIIEFLFFKMNSSHFFSSCMLVLGKSQNVYHTWTKTIVTVRKWKKTFDDHKHKVCAK